jgi:lipoyl(octanoyl) transferase
VTLLRVVQDIAKPGSVLMTEDSDLLQQADAGEVGATLRFYEWAEPTVSLGFHQRDSLLDFARLDHAQVPWVRRPTGGASVLHSEELTYSIVVPTSGEGAAAQLQEMVSRAIADGLRSVGVPAETAERGEPLSALPNRTSCFVRTSRWEVTVRGRKLVGSAQRKLPNALLQHGSILIGDDHLRITDFLSVSNEEDRKTLHERLRSKATCITAELGHAPEMATLREAMAQSFLNTFRAESSHAGLSKQGR